MKKRIRKTGEIVDVIAYSTPLGAHRCECDSVSYIDSQGVEHVEELGLNIHLDFENVEENQSSKQIDWEERRFNLASKLMVERLSCTELEEEIDSSIRFAILGADALIAELKKGGQQCVK